jgi:GDP-4-dehydro-6-deoxy-D-mannose reductase
MAASTLVTGAAGFAGGHLLDQLASDGVKTIAWHRPGGHAPRELPGVGWRAVDVMDPSAVFAAVAADPPAVVFHCAGAAHVGQSWDSATATLRLNVLGTHHLVKALRSAAPQAKLLITSSALVYGSSDAAIDESRPLLPSSPYGLSKIAQELVLAGDDGFRSSYIARPFNHVGPRQDATFASAAFAKQIAEIEAGLTPPEIHVGNLDSRRDLTDVRDTVRAYRLIVERGMPGRPYNICTGRAISIQHVLDLLLAHARVSVRVVHDPARYRPNDIPIVLGDPSRAAAELGWSARIPFEETARHLLDYWRAHVRHT